MAFVISGGFWLLTLSLLPFFGFMAVVTVSAFLPRKARLLRQTASSNTVPKVLIVIPAHDEEANVGATVKSCLEVTYDPSRFEVVVIADNCSDQTAQRAREAGAGVFERKNLERRSKGYALEDFLETHKTQSIGPAEPGYDFDVVVVVDADTVVDPTLLSAIAAGWREGSDWMQCYYTVRNPDASWRTRLLTYAFSLFNGVWLLGQDRLGLGAGFRGNGMAFSAEGLSRIPWKAYGLVEDQEFSWMLRVADERVRFLPDTKVYGEMVTRGKGAVSQRRRWEEGRRSLRTKFWRPILASRTLSPVHKSLALIDLFIPPLMPLMAGWLIASTGCCLPGLVLGWSIFCTVASVMGLILLAYALSPFLLLALPVHYLANLPMIPYYALWKLVVTFRSKTTSWVRTARES